MNNVMWLLPTEPVLAVLFEGWTCVAVIVMMLVGWIMNLVNNSKGRPAPAARRPGRGPQRRGDERLQSEIDNFLQEVGGGKRRDDPEELVIEIVPEEEQRRRRRPQSLPTQFEPQPQSADAPLVERHLEPSIESSTLGTELREHLTDYMRDDHIEEQVQHDLASGLGSKWASRGAPTVDRESVRSDSQASATGQPLAGRIGRILRNPATVRQAILINEVLSRPTSRRPK